MPRGCMPGLETRSGRRTPQGATAASAFLGGAGDEQGDERHWKPNVVEQDPGVSEGEVAITNHFLDVQGRGAEQKNTQNDGEH